MKSKASSRRVSFVLSFVVFAIVAEVSSAQAQPRAKPPSVGGACQYALDPATVQTQWTAFKTTAKVGVNGTFAKTELKGPAIIRKDEKLDRLLQSLEAEIALTPEQIQTKDPGRDATLYKSFFSLISKQKISGKIQKVKLLKTAEPSGTFTLQLTLNGKKHSVPFKFELQGENLVATGTLDMVKVGLKSSFESIHKACELLHTGADGVSKTWTEVDVRLSANVARICP